jgi:hypothetical protein
MLNLEAKEAKDYLYEHGRPFGTLKSHPEIFESQLDALGAVPGGYS